MDQTKLFPDGWHDRPEVRELVERAVAEATAGLALKRDEMAAEVSRLQAELEVKNQRLAMELVERGIRDAVSHVGEVYKNAWPDVIARGKGVFGVDEKGEVAPRGQDGAILLVGKDKDAAPLTFAQWAERLLSDAPHLFKATTRPAADQPAAGGSGKGNGQNVTISRDQARNPLHYRRAKELAAQRGVDLLIQ